MAVRIKFDNTHNVMTPTFVLATRSGKKLGVVHATNINVSDSFNSSFELTFSVHKVDNSLEGQLWDKITNFRLLWCREWDVWFEIYVEIDESNETVKNVSCISVGEAELSNINLYNIEINTENDIARDDYIPTVLYDEDNPERSLLTRITEKVPHYSFRHVDARIKSIQRTFTFNDISIYDAFQEIAQEINCIFVIDSSSNENGSIRREINVYDLEAYCLDCGHRDEFSGNCPKCGSDNTLHGYGDDTTVFVSTENLADNITLKTDTDSVKNCFRLEAGDELMTATVRNCSPDGSGYIWYITDETKDDMSDLLVERLNEYNHSYEFYQSEYRFTLNDSLLSKYNNLVKKYKQYDEDLKEIENQIVGYPNLMNTYYDIVDFYLLLKDSLMPSVELSNTSAAAQAEILSGGALSEASVEDLSKCSSSTASSTVLSAAKTIVDKRYQVKVKDGTLEGAVWHGSFTITNYSDETDTADTVTISVTLNDNYESFTKQKIEKVLKSTSSSEATDIVSLFALDYSSFVSEIKKYCLKSLQEFCDSCQSCLDILIEQGIADNQTWADKNPNLYQSLYMPYYNKLIALQSEIQVRESEISIIYGVYDKDGLLSQDGMQTLVENEKATIQEALNFERFLGDELWLEFAAYRREDTYTNSNYISDGLSNSELFKRALEFTDVAKKEIFKSATLQHSISATLKNLLVMKEFEPIVDYFQVGNWIRIRINETIYRLRLISYTIDFDDLDNLQIEFSDVKQIADGVSDSESIMNQADAMKKSYDTVTRQATQGAKTNSIVDHWFENGLDATLTKIVLGSDNQTQKWDEHGMLFRKYDYISDSFSDTQLKIINSTIAITDDNWETVKTAIGNYYRIDPETGKLTSSYGVNAETVVGKLIIGENLGIFNNANTLKFDENGLDIHNDKNSFKVNPNSTELVKISNENGDILWVDVNGVLHIKGDGSGLDISSNTKVNDLESKYASLKFDADGLTSRVETISNKTDTAYSYASCHYGTCNTQPDVHEKVVVCENFQLYTGAIIAVKFTHENTAECPTLNVNGTGAKTIYAYGSPIESTEQTDGTSVPSPYNWVNDATAYFTYNGSQWELTDSGALSMISSLSQTVRNQYSEITQTATQISAKVTDIETTTNTAYARATCHYGTCESEANSANKVVVCENFQLYTGAIIAVKFTHENTSRSPYLNVNNTGQRSIFAYGETLQPECSYNWAANATVYFTYNGSHWELTDSGALSQISSLSTVVTENSSAINQRADSIESSVTKATTYATKHYCKCTTSASTSSKIAECEGFELYDGAVIQVYFKYTNTSSSPTLNVNGTGAKYIRIYGTELSSNDFYNWSAGATVTFVYSGMYWDMAEGGAFSKVLQTANSWSVTLENDYAKKASLALEINSSGVAVLSANADSIEFTSNEISISSTNFNLTKAGVITATSGTIAGWSIDSSMIKKSTLETYGTASTAYNVYMYAPPSPNYNDLAIGVRQRSYDGSSYGSYINNFYVRYDGYLYAKSGSFGGSLDAATGTFSGDISAASGTFTGDIHVSSDICSIKLTSGQLYGYYGGNVAGYLNTYHTYNGTRAMRIGSVGGLVIASPHIAVVDSYKAATSDATGYEGGTGTVNYISNITDNGNGTITWTTKSLVFYNGIMCTAL